MAFGAKNKGANGEREAARVLTDWAAEVGVVLELIRNLEQVRGGGHDLTGLEEYGLAVEVKRVEASNVTGWWKQAVRQAEAIDCSPVLMHRKNRQKWQFRVRVWVHPANTQLDVDMTADVFRLWFRDYLLSKEGG